MKDKKFYSEITELLKKVDKPARYCGGEFNTPMIKENAELNFLMCFPDVYEVALSNLGIKILYHMLNSLDFCACESCFAPWEDMGNLLKERGLPLFSSETRTPINEFDIVGFSMQYELSYTNVLYMLDLGHIPLDKKDRKESDPLVIAGGPCMINPMPLAGFVDLFSIGDGEDTITEIAELYRDIKRAGGSKSDFLKAAVSIEGVYVPGLNDGKARRAIVKDLDKAFYPTKIKVPNMEAVHNRAVLEIFRGCTRGCRFCQAGMIYRPVRERSVDTLVKTAEELIYNNGYDEISFSSLSTCDYPYLKELLTKIKPITDKARVSISLPSTRVDSFEADFTDGFRKSSITFAPEAGTQRLRDVINKNVTEEDIFRSCTYAFQKGYSNVKLYFMIGLPTETREDIEGIPAICEQIKKLYREHATAKKPLSLGVSTSTFVPKPFTPFQWERQISLDEIRTKQDYLRDALKKIKVKYSWHDGKSSRIEATLARGGKELSPVLKSAYEKGCVFDSWSEKFFYDKWIEAFEENGVSPERYTDGFGIDEPLSWEVIDAGVTRKFLLGEREKAYKAITTPDCRKKCHNCGIVALTGTACENLCAAKLTDK